MFERIVLAVLLGAGLVACGGGGGSAAASAPAVTAHNVTITWSANREKGVNSAGGGYTLTISGQSAPVDVPYVSGATAPTSKVVSLNTGSYAATVKAYAALDASGGTTGSTSAATLPITIIVP